MNSAARISVILKRQRGRLPNRADDVEPQIQQSSCSGEFVRIAKSRNDKMPGVVCVTGNDAETNTAECATRAERRGRGLYHRRIE